MITKDKIEQLVAKYDEELRGIRRHLHRNPELSYQEVETSAYICKKLNEYGITFKTGYVKTGILAWIEGKNPDKYTLALRADMDALPINELRDFEFKSKNEGIMHACGHDMHMASVLGAAKILSQLKDQFQGRILFIFQPAEEKLPGGAKAMIEEGVFSKFKPDIILGQHVMPELKTGTVGFKPGVYMASTDEIYLTVQGKGGHAAMPDRLIDPVLIAAHLIVALQQLASRHAPPGTPTVLSFGKVDAAGANNIIPSEVKIAGTLRTMNEEWRKKAHQIIREMATQLSQSMGGSCLVEIEQGYPVVINHPDKTKQGMEFAKNLLGPENVFSLDPQMTAEDFAYYSTVAPSVFYRLGIDDPAGNYQFPLHSPNFGIDEVALKTSLNTMVWLTLCYLNVT